MALRALPEHGRQLPLLEPAEGSSYAVFDLETTGLNASTCTVLEIGWCVVRDGLAQPAKALLVRCDAVPREITALTGITTEMTLRDGVPLEHALRTFLSETAGLPLVGHNVLRFDMGFLEAACRTTGLQRPDRSRYRDTAALFKAFRLEMRPLQGQDHWSFAHSALDRRAPGLKFNLMTCCSEFRIPFDAAGAHRAAADVSVTQQLYERLQEGL